MRTTGSGVVFVAVVIFFLLPILYVLSLGPAVRLVEQNAINESAAEVVYYPLILLAENCPPVEAALTSYIKLWEVPSPSSVRTPNPAPAPVRDRAPVKP